MFGIGAAPVGSMAMKDVCDLQLRAAHGRRARLSSRTDAKGKRLRNRYRPRGGNDGSSLG
jgi:hypothetical protein